VCHLRFSSSLEALPSDSTLWTWPSKFALLRALKNADPRSFALAAARNMKAEFLLFAVLLLTTRASISEIASAPQRRIVFTRDSTLWTANLDGTKMRKLIKGADPCLSPDGTKVAFTMSPPAGAEVILRYIAVVEVATGATKIFKNTPSNNCFGPVWSPDGSQLLFEIDVEHKWRLGLLNADGSGFRFFKLPDGTPVSGWWSLTWAPDAKSIFCQDLEKICQFGINGDLLASWEIAKIIPKADLDSSERFSISEDGKRLLINTSMSGEDSLKNWDGPPPATWLFDLPSAKATRLTPKKSYAADACWLTNSEILLVDADKVGEQSSIYRASIAGGTSRLVIRNGANPSVSRASP
jgi:TolB protein